MRAEILPNAKQFETSSLGNCLVSELFQQFLRHLGNKLEWWWKLHSPGFWRCLSKEYFDRSTLATGEEEANIGVSLSAWSVVKAGVRKFRPLYDFTTCTGSLVANCYYMHTVAIWFLASATSLLFKQLLSPDPNFFEVVSNLRARAESSIAY